MFTGRKFRLELLNTFLFFSDYFTDLFVLKSRASYWLKVNKSLYKHCGGNPALFHRVKPIEKNAEKREMLAKPIEKNINIDKIS